MRCGSCLKTGGGAGLAGIGGAETLAGLRIDAYRFEQAYSSCFFGEFVASGFEVCCDVTREIGLEKDRVRKPLLVKAR